MSQLLTLSFHAPPRGSSGLLKEDALFKAFGLKSGLISAEAMQAAGDPGESLRPDPKYRASGLVKGEYETSSGGKISQYSLNEVGLRAWKRKGFKSPSSGDSAFEAWMKKVVANPASCLLLAGHHSDLHSSGPVLWGREESAATHRWFTAFLPIIDDSGKPKLVVKGHAGRHGGAVTRAGPFDVSKTLAECRLVVIMGCRGSERHLALKWQEWIEAATPRNARKKPLVLGWYETHKMPRDRHGETFSEYFWRSMKTLSQSHDNADLGTLCTAHTDKVIKAWGNALKSAFGKSAHPKCQKHLWFDRPNLNDNCAPWIVKGAGAFDPKGKEWRVKKADGELEKVRPI